MNGIKLITWFQGWLETELVDKSCEIFYFLAIRFCNDLMKACVKFSADFLNQNCRILNY